MRERDAILSPDWRYRYTLTRAWGSQTDPVLWVMLNPSTADHQVDDPTIRRCISFSQRLGFDAMVVVNLYALRATDPKELWLAEDPVGERNDYWISWAVAATTMTIAAWGANARQDRVDQVRPLLCNTWTLGLTKLGAPRHPLYLPKTAPLASWSEGC